MLSNHTQDQILIIALCASRRMAPYTTVVRSLEYNRCPSPPQRCPYPRTTTALSRTILLLHPPNIPSDPFPNRTVKIAAYLLTFAALRALPPIAVIPLGLSDQSDPLPSPDVLFLRD